ncbi:hypothetical protein [Microbacterium sp. W4I20]|uniref:hypothetical protein n=1 Tax=Microbacterium sp. W4I20 TaxID=3042262 RepID=UPI0027D88319|nr:hypothetical protein [Microbacterium sp. W4I20]
MKRIVLPLFDGLVVLMGFNGILNGMPSFALVYDPTITAIASWTLFMAGLVAFVGLAIPRLWYLEAVGKLAMVFVLGGYAGAVWIAYVQGDAGRGFVAAGLTGLLALPMWNLARLGRERATRVLDGLNRERSDRLDARMTEGDI